MTIIRSCDNMSSMKKFHQCMVDFIKTNGWYPDFKRFSTTIPSVKSFNRKMYLYLVHIDRYRLFCALYKLHIKSIAEAFDILRAQLEVYR